MKKFILILIITCLICVFNWAFSQNPLVKQWDKRYVGSGWEALGSIQQTFDGGYILGGYSSSAISGDKTQNLQGGVDYWIIKVDSLGNKQWDKDFGGTNGQNLKSLHQTSDGGYILGGYSSSGVGGDKTEPNWGQADFWIIKTDSLGNKIWDKDFGGTGYDLLVVVHQTFDGGYILGGISNSDSSGSKTQNSRGLEDYWIVRISSLGNKLWDKTFGGTETDMLSSVQQTSDGGFVLGGYSKSGAGGDKSDPTWGEGDYWIVKTDSLGNKQWDKDFGGDDEDGLRSIQVTTDGGYIMGGTSTSGISGDKSKPKVGFADYWIIKTDSIGNIQWEQDIGSCTTADARQITQTSGGGYLISGFARGSICGNKTEANIGVQQTWVVKTDSIGNIVWDKTLQTTKEDINGLAFQTLDGCYLMANETSGGIGGDKTQPSWDPFNNNPDFWIIKYCDTSTCFFPRPLLTRVDDTLYVANQYISYQWYNDTVPISGATNYFLYAPYTTDGIYYVLVTDSVGCTMRSGNSIVNAEDFIDSQNRGMMIYPNPVSAELKIRNEGFAIGSEITTSIYNMIGELVVPPKVINYNLGAVISVIDIPPGIYFIDILTGRGDYRIRFIKQ